MTKRALIVVAVALFCGCAISADAEVTGVMIAARSVIADGRAAAGSCSTTDRLSVHPVDRDVVRGAEMRTTT